MNEPLLTIRQVSELLSVPEATLRYWRHRGDGPAGFKMGRSVRYRASEVDRWLAELAANDMSTPRGAA